MVLGANLVAIIPARGGSKGFPRKNEAIVAGLPLLAHSIKFAQSISDSIKIIVSTDDQKLADIAKQFGAVVPELRPRYLSEDETPMPEVLKYAHKKYLSDSEYDYLLLLDPTSPVRNLQDIYDSVHILNNEISLDGVVSISVPFFNPFWVGVQKESSSNTIKPINYNLPISSYRQQVPVFYRVNGNFYLWRSNKIEELSLNYLNEMKIFGYQIDEIRGFSIDTKIELDILNACINSGILTL